jgi:hypothetical protein
MNNIITAILVLGIMGGVFGLILAIASKVFEVEKDPREEEILGMLAGANCGGCGFAGCSDCAAHIVDGTAPVNACAPAGPENASEIAKIMGVTLGAEEKHVAFVKLQRRHSCQASASRTRASTTASPPPRSPAARWTAPSAVWASAPVWRPASSTPCTSAPTAPLWWTWKSAPTAWPAPPPAPAI